MKQFHFFASSLAEWIATTNRRELPDLIEYMEKTGYAYTLWLVPGPWSMNYEIKHYTPQVEGVQLLGHFEPKNVRKKKYREIEDKIDKMVWSTV
jgi:hypothetical protein